MAKPGKQEVDRFILEELDSVPHLEALLLLWRRRPTLWSVEEMAEMLYVPPPAARRILVELARRHRVAVVPGDPERFTYRTESQEADELIEAVDVTYRRELVRVSNMIHSKAPAALREFARAFRFTKDRE